MLLIYLEINFASDWFQLACISTRPLFLSRISSKQLSRLAHSGIGVILIVIPYSSNCKETPTSGKKPCIDSNSRTSLAAYWAGLSVNLSVLLRNCISRTYSKFIQGKVKSKYVEVAIHYRFETGGGAYWFSMNIL